MTDGRDRLTRGEITKDALQAGAEAAAHTVGEVATIVTRAVGEVASAVGGFATEIFEIRDSSRRALADQVEEIGDDEAPPASLEVQPEA
ncbi:hypothetical protein ABFU82_03405 [Nocardioides sp. WV_118_6]|uniref:hypothetical protein n=1 Tax=Pimelobacter TaxID=2044 RepID=UPI001C056B07|nr:MULTISPECIES: hypothetical protein [Pimelobacter]MBU2696808.1 hypothetical protein [Pimelobacter sp. 30-1]UUW87372.1 hypothetical protein M0M43_16645 [Pimelobacter simplex]UUW96877.1 hypothetical protein M0M48_05290 [Pimelobacter simplex]